MAEDTAAPAKTARKAAPRKAPATPKTAANAGRKTAKNVKGPTVDTPTNTPEAKPMTSAPETAKPSVQSLKDNAAKVGTDLGAKAKTYAEDGKARAGGALDELAKMMTDAAGTVDEKIGEQYGQYARTAADAVSGFSKSLKAKNVDDLIADATSLVKKSPAVAIGAAAAIGFVLIRLMQSGLNADDKPGTGA